MKLNMARLKINKPQLSEWMQEREIPDRDYALHVLLSATFGQRALLNFRLMAPSKPGPSILYAYTEFDQDQLRATAEAVAEPLLLSIMDQDSIMTKPMPKSWKEGQLLGFNIRTRPLKRTRHDDKVSEVPVYPKGSNQTQRYDAHTNWFAKNLKRSNAAATDMVMITAQAPCPAVRARQAAVILGSEVIFQGNLIVTDPESFNNFLATGIGRHKAYGYGMVLLEPPHTNA